MSKETIKKIADYRENPVVRKHQRNEGYMAAWKETLLVIEWATKHQADNKIPNDARIASNETARQKPMQRTTKNQMLNDTDIESKKRKAENHMLNADEKIESKKRKVGQQNSYDVKIESKQRNAENHMLNDMDSDIQKREKRTAKSGKIESQTAPIAEHIIYLKKSRVPHIYLKPQSGMNKIVLIASGQFA